MASKQLSERHSTIQTGSAELWQGGTVGQSEAGPVVQAMRSMMVITEHGMSAKVAAHPCKHLTCKYSDSEYHDGEYCSRICQQ
jgi:hypothetical protein